MRSFIIILIMIFYWAGSTHAVQNSPGIYQSFNGRYMIYGGGLGDPYEPSEKDKRIAYWIKGQVAQQMFNAMGPDLRNVCGADAEQRIRQRAEIVCTASTHDGYSCSLGFDLVNGRSIGGSIC